EGALETVLVVCGLLTRGAGRVGVMTIMLVASAEPPRELGVRKALGASPRDLCLGTIGETLVITLGSGVVGVMLGFVLVELVGAGRGQTPEQRYWVPFAQPSLGLALLAFAVLAGAGSGSRVAPA